LGYNSAIPALIHAMSKLEQYRDPQLDTTGEIVAFYDREFSPLSNFASFAVEWQGRRWQTSEHAFQASIFMDLYPDLVEEIYHAKSAHDAKKIAEQNLQLLDPDWEERSVATMEDILRCKLEQNPYVQRKLLQTKDLTIVEDSPKDTFWGWGPDKNGRNELGKIWMKLREEWQERQGLKRRGLIETMEKDSSLWIVH
jgi:ribA/ribD-fused uncharacterized protein